jgi:hypothetical protein
VPGCFVSEELTQTRQYRTTGCETILIEMAQQRTLDQNLNIFQQPQEVMGPSNPHHSYSNDNITLSTAINLIKRSIRDEVKLCKMNDEDIWKAKNTP